MYHYVYETTNSVTGKYYIGVRSSTLSPLDDNYLGSGVALKRAIKKYGIDNFKKVILDVTPTKEQAFELEQFIVDQDFIDSRDNYNLSLGGFGGDRGAKIHKVIGEKCAVTYSNKSDEDKNKIREHLIRIRPLAKISEEGKQALRASKLGVNNPSFIGYWHTPLGTFASAIDAAEAHCVNKTTIHRRCNNPSSRWNEWWLEKVKEVEGD